MKAIVRNVLLACIISTFAFFGALGRKPVNHLADARLSSKIVAARAAEVRKETMTCLSVAMLAWVLCIWRCSVINRRLNEERMHQQRFNQYMRNNLYGSRQYR